MSAMLLSAGIYIGSIDNRSRSNEVGNARIVESLETLTNAVQKLANEKYVTQDQVEKMHSESFENFVDGHEFWLAKPKFER